MDGEFFVGASLATVLTKLALRFIELNKDTKKQNVCIESEYSAKLFLLVCISILNENVIRYIPDCLFEYC